MMDLVAGLAEFLLRKSKTEDPNAREIHRTRALSEFRRLRIFLADYRRPAVSMESGKGSGTVPGIRSYVRLNGARR
jgi:hypothetical protein